MQVKELKGDGLSYEMEVVVNAQDIDRHIDERLQEVGKTIKIPGFRPGKVPLDVLKQRYGQAVLGEVLEKAVNDSTAKVLQDKKLRPAMQPKIEVKEFDQGKDLKYTMQVEVLPEFDVMDLKTLKLEKPVAKPKKEAVDEALDKIAAGNRDTKPISEDRKTKKGDILLITYHGRTKKDNKAHEGMHAHGHQLELGSNQFIPGFEDQLTGKNKGDKVEVNVTFPEPYHSEELAGQEAIFDVEIEDILEGVDSKVDDDFAKKLGLENVKALREAVETQIQNEYDNISRMRLKRSMLDAIDENHDFEVPAGMLDMEFSNIKQQIALERQEDVKDGELQISAEEETELKEIAGRRVRLGMILSEIGRENNIQVNDQELQRAVIMEAQRFPGQEAEIFEYYRQHEQAREALRAPVFEDKVVDFIAELATVNEKEVSLDELTAEPEEGAYSKKDNKTSKKASGSKKKTASKKTSAKKASSSKKKKSDK
jgi:trigger factor